jgi:hypothetical protein
VKALRGWRVLSGRAAGNDGDRRVSPFLKVAVAAALLRAQHGEANARRIALTEQRRARHARSKRRFAFWADVAARIENDNCSDAANAWPAGGKSIPGGAVRLRGVSAEELECTPKPPLRCKHETAFTTRDGLLAVPAAQSPRRKFYLSPVPVSVFGLTVFAATSF